MGSAEAAEVIYDENDVCREGVRAEQIEGEIYLMATSPHYRHNEVAGNVYGAINGQLGRGKCRAYMDGIDFLYHPLLDDERKKDYVVPDVVIICDRDKIRCGSYSGKPKFILEVTSPSTAEHDRIKKFAIYEAAGVNEYWIASPQGTLDIYYLIDERYKLVKTFVFSGDKDDEKGYNAETVVTLRHFPVSMTLAEIFE